MNMERWPTCSFRESFRREADKTEVLADLAVVAGSPAGGQDHGVFGILFLVRQSPMQ
jgi:hypothetical protein